MAPQYGVTPIWDLHMGVGGRKWVLVGNSMRWWEELGLVGGNIGVRVANNYRSAGGGGQVEMFCDGKHFMAPLKCIENIYNPLEWVKSFHGALLFTVP